MFCALEATNQEAKISGERLQDHWSSGFICKNKGADQLHGNHTADQRFCFHYLDSTNPFLLKLEILSL